MLLNNGDGTFKPSVDYQTGRLPAEVVIGDLNGDGKPDVATANGDDDDPRGLSVLRGLGDGSLAPEREYRAGGGVISIALADLNGDGKLDAVTASGNAVGVLLNSTGMCNVPALRGLTLAAAKKALAGANCRLGKVARAHSKVAAGHVSSQKPAAGTVRPVGARIDLVVSLGRKR